MNSRDLSLSVHCWYYVEKNVSLSSNFSPSDRGIPLGFKLNALINSRLIFSKGGVKYRGRKCLRFNLWNGTRMAPSQIRSHMKGGSQGFHQWCGLRPSVLGQDRPETRKSVFILVLEVCWGVVKHGLVTLVVIMISKDTDTTTFQVLFIVSLFCVWNITDQRWRSLTSELNPTRAFVYFRWYWSWSWSWAEEFDLVYITGFHSVAPPYISPVLVDQQRSNSPC